MIEAVRNVLSGMRWRQWHGYVLALVVCAGAIYLHAVLGPWLGQRPGLILFVLPVIISAQAGGTGPGLLATAVTGGYTEYVILPPQHSFLLQGPADVVQWLMLVVSCLLISVFNRDSPLAPGRAPPASGKTTYQATVRKVQAGFGLALASLLGIGLMSWLSIVQLRENDAWVLHSNDVIIALGDVLRLTADVETGQRGFVLTGDDSFLAPYRAAAESSRQRSLHLVELTGDDASQSRRMEELARLVAERVDLAAANVDVYLSRGFAAARQGVLDGAGRELQDRIRRLVGEAQAVERSYLAQREQRAARSAALAQGIIIGGGVLAFCFVGIAMLLIRRDLARRQRAEAELENFFSVSLDFLCIASADGYFKRVSPAASQLLGWSTAELLKRPFMDFIHPDDRDAARQQVERQVVRGEKVNSFECRMAHSDGTWRVLSWRSMPQPGGMMYATARDVTDWHRMEQALRDVNDDLERRVRERTMALERSHAELRNSEVRFRALIENGADSIALIDRDNNILYVSPSVTAVEGYEPVELVGRNGIEHTHPDDLPLVRHAVEQMVAAPGKPIPVLWRRRHKDGRWLWLEGTATNLLDDPAVGAIVTNYRDVSERLRIEARIREQVEKLSLLDEVTRAIGERMDLPSIFQVVVRTLETSLPVDFCCIGLHDAARGQLNIARVGVRSTELALELAMGEGGAVDVDENGLGRCTRGALVYEPDLAAVQFPFPQRLYRGGLRSVVLAPLRSETSVFGVVVAARREVDAFNSTDCEFLRQVSEHVALAASQAQLHSALQEAYNDLRETQQAAMQEERLRALGQMASGIAHDINNALSPVALYADWLMEREPGLSDRARGYVEIIQRAVGDVAQTVARMREFYRQREAQVELAPVDLNGLVRQVLDLTRARWRDMAQQHGVDIRPEVDLAPVLPLVMGVESEIREALTNLVFNAADAMPRGGMLTLRTRVITGADDVPEAVSVEVCDEGVGMDEETRRRCLEPFFTTKGERGTGLGLPMVFGMVQRHSASMEIDSEPGAGATVRLLFTVSEQGLPAEAPAAGMPAVQSLRLLVVDDDPVLLHSVRNALEGDGHEVATASGGADGITAFCDAQRQGLPFAAVITDLGMPHVDGRKVAAAIKQASPQTPVILLTGWGQRLLADKDIPDHVDYVLPKPPRLRDLRVTLARCHETRTV